MLKKRALDVVFTVVAILAAGGIVYLFKQHEATVAANQANASAQAAANYAEGGGEYQDAAFAELESLLGTSSSNSTAVTAGTTGNSNTDGGTAASPAGTTGLSGTAGTSALGNAVDAATTALASVTANSTSMLGSAAGTL